MKEVIVIRGDNLFLSFESKRSVVVKSNGFYTIILKSDDIISVPNISEGVFTIVTVYSDNRLLVTNVKKVYDLHSFGKGINPEDVINENEYLYKSIKSISI